MGLNLFKGLGFLCLIGGFALLLGALLAELITKGLYLVCPLKCLIAGFEGIRIEPIRIAMCDSANPYLQRGIFPLGLDEGVGVILFLQSVDFSDLEENTAHFHGHLSQNEGE